ncbi:MAG: nucleotidyltransferase family protein [Bdellovibrionota bacterium]
MRALIMAAGLGTRLRPLTDTLPKPLVPVLGRPMVEYVLEVLAKHGYREAVMNVHYLPEKMYAFADSWNKRGGIPRLMIQDETKKILGTGGAISLAAKWLFEKESTALICNADTIAEPDLGDLLKTHLKMKAECTLALTPNSEAGRKYNGVMLENGLITGFSWPGTPDPSLLHFFGYYLINKSCMARLGAPGEISNILEDVWKPLVKLNKLGGWRHDGYYLDLGTPQDLREAEEILRNQNR